MKKKNATLVFTFILMGTAIFTIGYFASKGMRPLPLSGEDLIFSPTDAVGDRRKAEGEVRLLFVGDVMLGRLVNEELAEKPPEYVWGDTLPLFARADVRICNLENVISDRGSPWSATPKVFHFRTDPSNVEALKVAGIDAVSIANNHALDYGNDALFQMLDILDGSGIHRAGAGHDFMEAASPAIFEANGLRIGLIAFTDNEAGWEAKEKEAGVFYVPVDINDPRAERLFELIRRTRPHVDMLIVSAHWGPNWGLRPPAEQVPFGHAIIDAGADVIFGHSAHVFRGIEIYKGKPILYSTGDFIDDYAVNPLQPNDESFVFIVNFRDGAMTSLELYPTRIQAFSARRAKGRDAAVIAEKMRVRSEEFGTSAVWNDQEGFLEIRLQ